MASQQWKGFTYSFIALAVVGVNCGTVLPFHLLPFTPLQMRQQYRGRTIISGYAVEMYAWLMWVVLDMGYIVINNETIAVKPIEILGKTDT
jgi:hypothetical protein